eukprot:14074708-Ditylum_brightwellii.AAC.1
MNQIGVNHVNYHYQLCSSCFVDAAKTTMRCHPWYCGGVWYNWVEVAYVQCRGTVDHIPS